MTVPDHQFQNHSLGPVINNKKRLPIINESRKEIHANVPQKNIRKKNVFLSHRARNGKNGNLGRKNIKILCKCDKKTNVVVGRVDDFIE
jgi:hypothetical protein